MTEAIRELKIRAEILHKRITTRDSHALETSAPALGVSPFLREDLVKIAPTIRRRDCLTTIAAELVSRTGRKRRMP